MKKLFAVVLVAGFCLSLFTAPSEAMLRKDLDILRGKVTAVSVATKQVTVRDSSTGMEKTFTARKGVDPKLMVGASVTIIFKKGTNVANSITPSRRRY